MFNSIFIVGISSKLGKNQVGNVEIDRQFYFFLDFSKNIRSGVILAGALVSFANKE